MLSNISILYHARYVVVNRLFRCQPAELVVGVGAFSCSRDRKTTPRGAWFIITANSVPLGVDMV